MALFIDTETNGLPDMTNMKWGQYPDYTIIDKYDTARIVQLSYIVTDYDYNKHHLDDFVIKRENFNITNSQFHSITDEISDIETLRAYLKPDARFFERGAFDSITKMFAFLKDHKIDLVFADIKIGDTNLLTHWAKMTKRPEIILITSYPQYALPAFAVEALHFITKPINSCGR